MQHLGLALDVDQVAPDDGQRLLEQAGLADLAAAPGWAPEWVAGWWSSGPPPSRLVAGSSSVVLGPVAGEVEEDVVEAGPLEAEVVEVDAAASKHGRDAGDVAPALRRER